ncbi:hypothetical protein ELQ90_14335 [Labedella phragmitis]|uniref:Sortase n=1 Tax=Labedella phragmitis TaxID=2498849 RepID=A0A3S3ZX24_9MICO|nr:hypothetical protein [Labedella phragmitis]RWZ46610.1 hypothetical protein ELQ90_14335 [Labedella phragmitis]
MFRKIIAGAGIALVAVFAAPAAAQAVYGPDESVVVDGEPAPGETVEVTFDEVFEGDEQVSGQVSGNGQPTIAIFKAATDSVVKSAVDGTVAFDVTLPTDATGTYTVTATGLESGLIAQADITVVAEDGSGAGDEDGDGLAVTGGTALTAIWIAAGALGLGIVLLLVRTLRRNSNA